MTGDADDRSVVEVKLPQLGESVAEGTVVTWLASPGDTVAEDDPLCEIATDKVNTDLPSPASGELVELVAEEGQTVEVGAVLARIAVRGGAADRKVGSGGTGEEEAAGTSEDEERPHFEDSSIALWGGHGGSEPEGDGEADEASAPTASRGDDTPRHSPAVRALAREEGVDLSEVDGTGRGGRITREDVRHHLEERAAAGGPGPAGGRREELSPVRHVIAERLSESKAEIPHSTTVMEADFARVAEIREAERAAFEDREGVRLTYLPFVAFAAVRALDEHERVNAVFEGDAIRYRDTVNLGVAVATEEGLLVPVVPNAGRRSFAGLARAMSRAADGAREGTLEPDDVQGGTFTLTNHGRGGSLLGTPIIVPGQSGILGVGTIRDEPVAVNGEVAVRKRGHLSLSFDHRTIDGAEADAFLRTVVAVLASFPRDRVRGEGAPSGGRP